MAKAYQCDRCGKLYKKPVNDRPKFTLNMHGYNWPFADTDDMMDLCLDFREKLEKFVIEGGFYEEESE